MPILEKRPNPLYLFPATITRVKDGDTYVATLDQGFGNSKKSTFRMRNIDTPETHRPKSEAEREHGKQATAFLKGLVDSVEGKVYIQTFHAEASIYGRYDATAYLTLDDWWDGKAIATSLSEAGFDKKSQAEYKNSNK